MIRFCPLCPGPGRWPPSPAARQRRVDEPITYLSEHGYIQVHTYQPGSRYWTFQWIALSWLVLVSLALLGLTFWLVRRRSI